MIAQKSGPLPTGVVLGIYGHGLANLLGEHVHPYRLSKHHAASERHGSVFSISRYIKKIIKKQAWKTFATRELSQRFPVPLAGERAESSVLEIALQPVQGLPCCPLRSTELAALTEWEQGQVVPWVEASKKSILAEPFSLKEARSAPNVKQSPAQSMG